MGNPELTGFSSGARGGWFGEPDHDAPHHHVYELLPAHARCETCRHWCGQCLSPEVGGPVKRAEDRCEAWQVARDHEVYVNERVALWDSQSWIMRQR